MVDLELKRDDVELGSDLKKEEVKKESAPLQVLNEKVQINFDEQ